ncbi:hypothetical protein DL765_000422 [Monosporascus sp. GIB2]|nr:hypothetical protein DL765_000422 [Monosporascus sp. GIB2]
MMVAKQLASATGRHFGVKLTVADYRYVAIELGRKIRGLAVRQLEVEIGADDGGRGQAADDECGDKDPATGEARARRKMEYIWDLQATYGNAIAHLGDAGGGDAPPSPRKEGGKAAAAAATANPEKGRKRPAAGGGGNGGGDEAREVGYGAGGFKRRKTAVAAGPGAGEDGDVDIEAALRKLFGKDARWRSGE